MGLVQPIIVAVTGHTEESYVAKAYSSGMNQVSTKPIDHELLKEILRRINYIE